MERRRKQYLERLKIARGTKKSKQSRTINTEAPHVPDFLYKNHKKEQIRKGKNLSNIFVLEREQIIAKENDMLYNQLKKIMTAKKGERKKFVNGIAINSNGLPCVDCYLDPRLLPRSMNYSRRAQQFEEINKENERILKDLEATESYYPRDKLLEEYEYTEYLLSLSRPRPQVGMTMFYNNTTNTPSRNTTRSASCSPRLRRNNNKVISRPNTACANIMRSNYNNSDSKYKRREIRSSPPTPCVYKYSIFLFYSLQKVKNLLKEMKFEITIIIEPYLHHHLVLLMKINQILILHYQIDLEH